MICRYSVSFVLILYKNVFFHSYLKCLIVLNLKLLLCLVGKRVTVHFYPIIQCFFWWSFAGLSFWIISIGNHLII